jgi:asparagine synthase (glutamine-hydrolysing)
MLGQLADELFGGYAKYERKLLEDGRDSAAKLMIDDVAGCGARGFVRDEAACSRWLEPRFPFADARVAGFGLRLPVELKIRRGVRKAVLREAALRLGVPGELVNKPKKAAQYSSGIMKILT